MPAQAPPVKEEKVGVWMDVADHPVSWLWMKEVLRRNPEEFFQMIGYNFDFFRRQYGAPDQVKNNGKKKTFFWTFEEQGLVWKIETGAHGTIFSVKTLLTPEEFVADKRIGSGMTRVLQSFLHFAA